MVAEDTAAPVADTVTEPVEAPEPIAAAETATAVVAETEPQEATETVRSWTDSLVDVPDEDLSANERIKSLIARREESARQKEADRLRREAGKAEVVTQQVDRFLREQGYDVEDKSRLNFLYSLAKGHADFESASEFAEALRSEFNIPVDFKTKAVEAREQGNFSGYVLALVEGAAAAKESEIEARLRKEYDARLVAELKAKEIKEAKEPPPTTERGSPVGGPTTWQSIDSQYTDSQWRALPAAERARLSDLANANLR